MRIQFEIKESLINILDQLMHSDFWATEIKEDESGKKIIKIKDLAYNLEAVAEVMGNEIFIRTALSILEINKRLHSRTLKLNNNENRYRQYSGLYQ